MHATPSQPPSTLRLPVLPSGDDEPLEQLIKQLAVLTGSGVAAAEGLRAARAAALEECQRAPLHARSRLSAAVLVVCDLAQQGWTFSASGGQLSVSPPVKSKDQTAEKARVREQLHVERDRQLRSRAVRSFIRGMEARRLHRGRFVSIFDLMRDGRELAARLEAASGEDLHQVIQPYLQLVEGDEVCARTGLKLREIWRYFRHTWATPYRSTPGRSVMILVRDRAAKDHPVIGIAALSSAAAQIRRRDEWIGWTSEQVLDGMRREPTDDDVRWLRGELERALSEIYVQDFLEDGLLVPSDLRRPRPGCVGALSQEAVRQRGAHDRFVEASRLKQDVVEEIPSESEQQLSMLPRDECDWAGFGAGGGFEDGEAGSSDEPGGWEIRARSHLFRSKRADQLARLLLAREVLSPLFEQEASGPVLREVLKTEAGARAVRDLTRRAKADRMGVHIAEISICGAVQPYSTLLGGKLVGLMMTSPELQEAYRARYGRYQSLIASSKAGRPIVRGAELALLMTTSLYGSGSSQYSRLRVSCERVGGGADEEVRYEQLGRTEGYGTSHFSDESVEALSLLISQEDGGRRINSIFGEGVNPRLRKVREGLSILGFPDDDLLKHGSPRIIYGISLVRNLRRYLLGIDERPDYLFAQDELQLRTQQIVRWWVERWLRPRCAREDILQQVRQHRLVCPPQHGARVCLPEEETPQLPLFAHA